VTAVEEAGGGYRLDGVIPWVTAAPRADVFVVGAVLADGRQLLLTLPADREGLTVRAPFELAALQASCPGGLICEGVAIGAEEGRAGPSGDVMSTPGTAGTGGLETSALALGQARAALAALAGESSRRDGLTESIEALAGDWRGRAEDLLAA